MSTTPRVVIIGAGIVGTNLADELTARGVDRVTVVDQGPLPLTGGSTSHAPGLVFQTNPSKTMTAVRDATRSTSSLDLDVDGAWCFNQVGGLEVATTPERLADLHRRQGGPRRGGSRHGSSTREECVRLHSAAGPRPGPRRPAHRRPTAWPRPPARWSRSTRRAEAAARVFQGSTRVIGIEQAGGRVTGVRTADGRDRRPTSWCPAPASGAPSSARWSAWTSRCCRWPTST